jgi:hypothetical protein
VNITVDTVKPSAPTIDSPKDNSIDRWHHQFRWIH